MPDPIEDPQNTPDPASKGEPPQGDPQEPDKGTANPTFQAITSQEEFDKTLGKRLAAERAKYAGFDDLKAKASKYDELEDAKKTAEQKLTERLQALESENSTLRLDGMRAKAAKDAGLDPELAPRLRGNTPEELAADAAYFAEKLPKPAPNVPLSQRPRENLRGGGRPAEEPEETDPRKLAAKIPR